MAHMNYRAIRGFISLDMVFTNNPQAQNQYTAYYDRHLYRVYASMDKNGAFISRGSVLADINPRYEVSFKALPRKFRRALVKDLATWLFQINGLRKDRS